MMDSDNTKMITTKGIVYKIKQFFRRLFKHKEKIIQANQANEEEQNTFKEGILIKVDEEEQRLLKLQTMFRNKQIKEEDLLKSDAQKLSELYDKQILKLQDKIKQNILDTEKYKKDIISIKNKL